MCYKSSSESSNLVINFDSKEINVEELTLAIHNTFDENDRNELLFHIFKRIVIGGSLCQFEEYIQPYLDMTKCFYKDMVSPAKDPETKEIYIRSVPVEIYTIEDASLYKKKGHPQNFFYVIIDPYQRYVHLWYHNWIPFW